MIHSLFFFFLSFFPRNCDFDIKQLWLTERYPRQELLLSLFFNPLVFILECLSYICGSRRSHIRFCQLLLCCRTFFAKAL